MCAKLARAEVPDPAGGEGRGSDEARIAAQTALALDEEGAPSVEALVGRLHVASVRAMGVECRWSGVTLEAGLALFAKTVSSSSLLPRFELFVSEPSVSIGDAEGGVSGLCFGVPAKKLFIDSCPSHARCFCILTGRRSRERGNL